MTQKLNFFQTRPKAAKIDVDAYLRRLQLTAATPDLVFLRKLHRAHLLNIPFENLDIHFGKKIVLSVDPIFKKIVYGKRGGFCYELNTLFYHLLCQLGFDARLGSARVFTEESGLSPEYDHMIVFVMLNDEQYLADVGFGQLFSEPKKLNTLPQLDYTEYFRFTIDPDGFYILKRSKDGSDYASVYRFALKTEEMITFLERCNYHQESPDSHFIKNKLITQLFKEGRITLTDRKVKMKWKGEEKEFPVSSEDEFLAKLKEYFGIDGNRLLREQFDKL